ncbi:MAG: hypothetical protein WCY16_05625 [Weeksellaceae bacterium]
MIEWQEITIRLVPASIFGAPVGLERERKSWSAGMRTHMMGLCGFLSDHDRVLIRIL